MQGSSQADVGLSSMVKLLTYIAQGTEAGNNFLYNINKTTSETLDVVKHIFNSSLISKSEKVFKIRETREKRKLDIFEEILYTIKNFGKDKPYSIREDVQKNIGSLVTNIKNQFNFYLDDVNVDTIKALDNFLVRLTEFVNIKPEKFKIIGLFFKNLNIQLEVFRRKVGPAATSLMFITGALIVLSYVSWVSIGKMVVVLGFVGIALSLFITRIIKAVSSQSFWKTLGVMLFLPDVLIALGKSILFISAALWIFNHVGWDAIVKFTLSLVAMGAVFKYFFQTNSEFGFALKLMSLAFAMATFAPALMLMDRVNWSSVGKLLVFIGGLGAILKVFNFSSNIKGSGIMQLGIGIGILVLALSAAGELNWTTIGGVVAFIFSLGLALRFVNGGRMNINRNTGIMGFAFGFGILIIALAATEELNWKSILAVSAFVIGLSIALRIVSVSGRFGKLSGITGFGIGFGILIIALAATEELSWTHIFKVTAFIIGLSLALRLVAGRGTIGGGLLGFAIGFGLIVLVISALGEIPNDTYKLLFSVVGFVAALGLVLHIFPKWGSLIMIGMAIGLAAISFALMIASKVNLSWEQLGILGAAIGGLATIMGVIGIPVIAAAIGLGIVVTIGMAIGLVAISFALMVASKVGVNYPKLLEIGKGISAIALGFAALTPVLVLALPAALAFIPIAIVSLVSIFILQSVSKLDVNNTTIDNFMSAVERLTKGWSSIFISIVPAALSAVAFVPIALASLVSILIVWLISKIEIDNTRIDSFTNAVKTLVKTYSGFSLVQIGKGVLAAGSVITIMLSSLMAIVVLRLISKVDINQTKIDKYNTAVHSIVKSLDRYGVLQLGKSVLKSAALVPIFGVMYLAAKTLKLITETEYDATKIGKFSGLVNFLVDNILLSLSENESKLKKAQPGLKALAKLVSISRSLAETIGLMANLKFYEVSAVNGKLVYTNVRQLKDTDFQMVGKNLALILETLIEPLAILGSNESTFVIGGKVIANPFKDNTTLKGIDMIKRLSTAFKPLAESIKDLGQSGVVSDASTAALFSTNLMRIAGIYAWFFKQLDGIEDRKKVGKLMDEIVKFNTSLGEMNIEPLDKFNLIFDKIIDKFVDDVKWRKIQANLKMMKGEFSDISKIINNINIEKATLFEKTLARLLTKEGKGLVEAAEALRDILTIVNEHQKVQSENMTKQIEMLAKSFETNNNIGLGGGVLAPTISQQPQPQQPHQLNVDNSDNSNNSNNQNSDVVAAILKAFSNKQIQFKFTNPNMIWDGQMNIVGG